MARTRRPVSRAAARLAGDAEPPDLAAGPAAPSPRSLRAADRSGRSPALIVTSDPDLLDDLLRIAGRSGVAPDVAPDPTGARRCYVDAAVVLIGADMATSCARAGLPRRSGVVVVARGPIESSGPGLSADVVEAYRAADGSSNLAEDVWGVARWLGADHVAILPDAEPWLVRQLVDVATTATSGRVVAVLGGRGGAGASVLSGALAVTAARRGLRTLLVDGDPLGGGVDLVLGWESLDGLRWPALAQASGRVPAPALVDALPGRAELVVLSWDRGEPVAVPPEAMLAALDAGRRGRDMTVVDLPRRLDDSSTLALRGADQVYLVVPAELRACAAAGRVAATIAPHCGALSVVVRQPGPGGLAVKEVVAALGLPYAGTLRSDARVRSALERGEPPAATGQGSLATLCEKLLDDVLPPVGGAA